MEFGFTFWKRYDRMQVLGAQGDRPSSNKLGQPAFPEPSNEYYHTYCNANSGMMMMGSSTYSSSIIDQTLITGTYSTEFSLGLGLSDNVWVEMDETVCLGVGVMKCETPFAMTATMSLDWKMDQSSGKTTEGPRAAHMAHPHAVHVPRGALLTPCTMCGDAG